MQEINKVAVLDQCISGNMSNYKTLLNPMCNQFNEFYKLLKSLCAENTDMQSSVGILFRKEDNNAVFEVTCDCDINDDIFNKPAKGVIVTKHDKVMCFNIQSCK